MVKHISIKAASCLDMINALNSRIAELDPNYVGASKCSDNKTEVTATEDGFLSEDEMYGIDRNGTDEEVAIAAISYNLGIPWSEAADEYPNIDAAKLQEYIDYYLDRDLPVKERLERRNARNAAKSVEGSEIQDQEYINGAEGDISEEYVDDMMQYVADKTVASLDSTCSWEVNNGNLIFIVAGLESETVDEYTCPLADLTGDVDTDVDYILRAIGLEEEVL